MKISEMIDPKSIILNVDSVDKKEVLAQLVKSMCETYGYEMSECEEIFNVIWEREQIMSTGIGNKVAVPHGITPFAKEILISFGTSSKGVAYNDFNTQKVEIFFPVVIPKGRVSRHLQTLRLIAKLVSQKEICEELRKCKTPDRVIEIISKAEEQMI